MPRFPAPIPWVLALSACVPPAARFATPAATQAIRVEDQRATGPLGTVRAYQTLAGGERVAILPLASPDSMLVVYSIRVDSLRAGDLLEAHGDIEVTNDCGFNIAIGTFMILAPDPATTVRSSDAMVAYAAGFNVTPNMHHGLASRSGAHVIARDIATTRVNFVAYAQSTGRGCPGLRVERGYGQLVVLHHSR